MKENFFIISSHLDGGVQASTPKKTTHTQQGIQHICSCLDHCSCCPTLFRLGKISTINLQAVRHVNPRQLSLSVEKVCCCLPCEGPVLENTNILCERDHLIGRGWIYITHSSVAVKPRHFIICTYRQVHVGDLLSVPAHTYYALGPAPLS